MSNTPQTLSGMTHEERVNFADIVVESLEAFAEEAEGAGDAKFAANSLAIACTIRGCGDLSGGNLRAAELLLEQGIVMMNAYKNRETYTQVN
ncbi:hypothetical protein [Rhizobium sp. BK251]|uniref:hypothetical protein n=1 Tax=Rhizobium sp. BK251 TaxID=2512125 RepID=UPI00104EC488|nr:hypothetical protein [Rhizobium sp. BK251]TCL74895.1 hypothetical protein EV286_102459 [Rhizobium sp. BK251]